MQSNFLDAFGALPLPRKRRSIVDQLIEERTRGLSKSVFWPVIRPALNPILHYHQAVQMADDVAGFTGRQCFDHMSVLLSLEIETLGLEHVPAQGGFILAPNHPTGIVDGIAVHDALKQRRDDYVFLANRDALRVNPRLGDMVIPVEWKRDAKSHSKSRYMMQNIRAAIDDNKALVVFPSGRIAFLDRGQLTERPWQSSVVALARKYQLPIVPLHIKARNSILFYVFSQLSHELRDMTLFHELLNKKQAHFRLHFGAAIRPEQLNGDLAETTKAIQHFTCVTLGANPKATFTL